MQKGIELLLTGHQFRHLYEKEYSKIMTQYALRKIEIDVLYLLSLRESDNTAKQLSKDSHISKAHISKAVENLERNQLIMLEADEHDHRVYHIKLTDNAKCIVDDIDAVHTHMFKKIFAGISEDEKKMLANIAHKILANIEDAIDAGREGKK